MGPLEAREVEERAQGLAVERPQLALQRAHALAGLLQVRGAALGRRKRARPPAPELEREGPGVAVQRADVDDVGHAGVEVGDDARVRGDEAVVVLGHELALRVVQDEIGVEVLRAQLDRVDPGDVDRERDARTHRPVLGVQNLQPPGAGGRIGVRDRALDDEPLAEHRTGKRLLEDRQGGCEQEHAHWGPAPLSRRG